MRRLLALTLLTATPAFAVPPTGFVYPTTTLELQRDFRRCVSPMCGGWWVSRVNHASMRCPDGTVGTSCYIASVEWVELGLTPQREADLINAAATGLVLVRGDVEITAFPGFPDLGVLHPISAWSAVVP
jgi:hypothetical protein